MSRHLNCSPDQQFSKMARLSEEEVTAAMKDVEKLFMKASCSPVCQNQQEAVFNCYQDHPHQSLRCTRQVENFTQCVDLARLVSTVCYCHCWGWYSCRHELRPRTEPEAINEYTQVNNYVRKFFCDDKEYLK